MAISKRKFSVRFRTVFKPFSDRFGRTDLRRVVSGAKFDAESDFEIRFAIAPQKPNKNREKLFFRPDFFYEENGDPIFFTTKTATRFFLRRRRRRRCVR